MNKFITLGVGIGGLCVGFICGFVTSKRKYEAMAEEEIESVKRAFKSKELRKAKKDKTETTDTKDVNVSKNKAERFDYTSRAAKYRSKNEDKPEKSEPRPVYISEEEIGQNPDYELEDLTYYRINDILADEYNEPMSTNDIQAYVGLDFKHQFDKNNVEKVFVKNDIIEKYFIIISEPDTDYDTVRR